MVRKVRAGGKRAGGEEGERAVHRLKDVFGNVEETLIRKVLASCENDFDAAANALLSKRKTNELVGQWKDTNNEKKRRKNRRANSTKSEGGGGRKSFFTVFVYGFPWIVPREEIEEAMYQLLDPEAKDQVLQVRIPTNSNGNNSVNSAHGGFGFADVVERPKNLQLATRLQQNAQAGELVLFNKQVGLEVQSKGEGYSVDLASELEAVDVSSRRFGRGTRPGFSDGGKGMSLDEREEEEEDKPQKQKGKNKKKKDTKLGGGGGGSAKEFDEEVDLVDAFNETLKRKAELKLELVEVEQREQELKEKIRSELVVLQRRCERMSMVSTKINPMNNVGGGSTSQGTSAFPYSVSNSPPSTPDLPSPPSMQNASTLCWSSRVKLT